MKPIKTKRQTAFLLFLFFHHTIVSAMECIFVYLFSLWKVETTGRNEWNEWTSNNIKNERTRIVVVEWRALFTLPQNCASLRCLRRFHRTKTRRNRETFLRCVKSKIGKTFRFNTNDQNIHALANNFITFRISEKRRDAEANAFQWKIISSRFVFPTNNIYGFTVNDMHYIQFYCYVLCHARMNRQNENEKKKTENRLKYFIDKNTVGRQYKS